MSYSESSIIRMRRKLAVLARSLRQSVIPDKASVRSPQSVKEDYILFENEILRRKRIVLLASACSVATCTMCPLTNEALDTTRRTITVEDIIHQFEISFNKDTIDDYQLTTIYIQEVSIGFNL